MLLNDRTIPEALVPNVVDMGLKDALYLLESRGIRVVVNGRGTVRQQSSGPGSGSARAWRVQLKHEYKRGIVKLEEIIKGMEALEVTGSLSVEPAGISFDSRQVAAGDLFVAIRGGGFDGHDFIPEAISAGAVAVVSEEDALEAYPGYKLGEIIQLKGGPGPDGLCLLRSPFQGSPPWLELPVPMVKPPLPPCFTASIPIWDS